MTSDPAGAGGLRASDAERSAVADRLSAALADGRLDLDEYQERLDSAMRSTTTGQLVPLTADLPDAPVGADGHAAGPVDLGAREDGPRKRPWDRIDDDWRNWLGAAVIMTAIWAVTGITSGFGTFWPLIPLGIWAAVLVAGRLTSSCD
ncbi:DUF1707 SHOCT-like domain-containing protein [Nocardiopsis coralliicola]